MTRMKEKLRQWMPKDYTGYIKPVMLLAFIIVVLVKAPVFFQWSNLIGLLSQGATIGLASLGMTLVIITGGIDISMGGCIYVSGVIATEIYRHTPNLALAILGGLLVGTLCGLINGIGVAYLQIPALITTLATSLALQGAGSLMLGEGAALNVGGIYKYISQTKILGLQSCAWIFLAFFLLFVLLFKTTKFAKYVYALGDNPDAFRASGVRAERVYLSVYTIAGLMCGIAGIVTTARLGGTQYNMSLGTETYCIAAVVIGGASMEGGKGSIFGTFAGVLIVAALDNLLRLMKINAYVYDVIWGIVLFVVVSIDVIRVRQLQRVQERTLRVSQAE